MAQFSMEIMRLTGSVLRGNQQQFVPDYLDALNPGYGGSINDLYVRRGVFMPPGAATVRKELFYLSSYSLAFGPVEQFAQTQAKSAKSVGVPTIFSAPLPAVQTRIVAFAPFIAGMTLGQLEVVVAPPVESVALRSTGTWGGIHEVIFE